MNENLEQKSPVSGPAENMTPVPDRANAEIQGKEAVKGAEKILEKKPEKEVVKNPEEKPGQTAAENGAAAQKDRIASLEAREKALSLRELRLDAEKEAQKRGLPLSLTEVLPMEDREKCFAALDTLEKAFRKAVRAAVEEKLRAETPPAAPAGDRGQYAQMLRKALGLA